ncbi:MAG: four helix bundle protein [Nitrospirae bacterium]|nr:four helix bundle protein [Nitrospirota bacterium]
MKAEGRKQNYKDLKDRTKQFALRIIRLCLSLPKTNVAQVIGNQLLRSGTSVGANYRESCRARSNAEFVSKINIALQELEETAYWLELLVDSKITNPDLLNQIQNEVDELISIFISIVKKVSRE